MGRALRRILWLFFFLFILPLFAIVNRQLQENQIHTIERGAFEDLLVLERL
jgi:hypothetical protein